MCATTWIREPRSSSGAAPSPAPPTLAGARPEPWVHSDQEGQFLAMVHAYRRTGGLAGGDEVAGLMCRRSEQPISVLARWIVSRSLVSFVWGSQTLVPLFQFDLADMSLRSGAREVVQELAGVFDDWDLAMWFAQPNSWLQGAAPVNTIALNQSAVLQAARADRFIAHG